MGRYASERVNGLFTWEKVTDRIAALYERVRLTRGVNADQHAEKFIEQSFGHAAEAFMRARQVLTAPILQAANILSECFRRKRKVLICGNGGSAAETQHLAAELVGRFEVPEREGLPAFALTGDSAVMTAWANDFGYENVFSRQVEAYGSRGDVLVCFSTSGEPWNVVKAMKAATAKGMTCIALTGKGGGKMSEVAHVNITVPSGNTQRIQELHLHILHTLCSLVEQKLFSKKLRSHVNGNGQLHMVSGSGDAGMDHKMGKP